MQIWSAILSNTKTAEEIRDGSASFTIRLVPVKNVTLKKFKVEIVNLNGINPGVIREASEIHRDGSPSFTIRLVLVKNVTLNSRL